MKVSELGEFGLIDLLSQIVAGSGLKPTPELLIGIGDDTAAWQSEASIELITTDTLVQGIHFTSESTWRELGWKALAINLSDVAAMGGYPLYSVASLALPGDTEVDSIAELYQGMVKIAKEFGVALVGGNISSAPLVVITIALVGKASEGNLLTRSAAIPGDVVAVTGYLGSSAAGAKMLIHHLQLDPKTAAFLRKAHLQPQPRIAQGQLLVHQGVKAAIDISDGLLSDLNHICQASKVGARIRVDQLPIHPVLRKAFSEDCLSFALSGGEDYELLFTCRPGIMDKVKREADCPMTVVGEIVEDELKGISLLDATGKPFSRDSKGWEHFVSGSYES